MVRQEILTNVSRVIILAVSGSCRNLMNPIAFLIVAFENNIQVEAWAGRICMTDAASGSFQGGFFKQERLKIEIDSQ